MDRSPNTNLPTSTGTRTPTHALSKRIHINSNTVNGADRAGSEPIDPTALSKALKDFEDAHRTRDRTPGASPSRKRQRIYGDRLVQPVEPREYQFSMGREAGSRNSLPVCKARWRRFKGIVKNEQEGKADICCVGLYLTGKDKICMPASICYTTLLHLQPLQKRRSERLTASYISREVRSETQYNGNSVKRQTNNIA